MVNKFKDLESEVPILEAKREWNIYTGNVMGQKTMWQTVAFLSLAVALAAVAGLIYIGSQSKFVPYVVAVNKLGDSFAVQRADRATPLDPKVLRVSIARFVCDARGMCIDPIVQQEAVWRVYSMLRPQTPAIAKMSEYRQDKENSPDVQAESLTSYCQILNILQQSPSTYEITWKETLYNREDGARQGTRTMRGLFKYKVVPPDSGTSEESLQRNPLGVFIEDFSWGEIANDIQDIVETQLQ